MAFVKKHRRGDTTYYELVEGYRDEQGKVRHRSLKWLGTNPNPPPEAIPLKGLDFASLAAQLMEESLTADDVLELLQRMGKDPKDLRELDAIGIRFDLRQKKLELHLFPKGYDWKMAPRRAAHAKPASAGKGPTKGAASSPSKEKPE